MQKTEEVAKSYTGIYSMHKYWSKKPFNLVRNLILNYSQSGDIVLDAFSGSGISVIESILTCRKAVGIDINPAATFITKQILLRIDPDKIQNEYEKIQNYCESKINKLYHVKRNNQQFIGTHFVWLNNVLQEVWYFNEDGKKIISEPTKEDIKLTNSFSYEKIPYYYPKSRLFHNSRINASSKMHVYDLFTARNAYALSLLLDRINKISNHELKELFQFCFTAALGQSSRMVFVINKRGKINGDSGKFERKELGSWVIGYWVPKENFEVNVWNCFSNRYRRILKAKKEQYERPYTLNFVNSFSQLQNGNLCLINDSALTALKQIPSDSIDYVITDPPHGNRQPYLELSMMWNDWLGKKVNYEDEIVISEAKRQKKDLENYNHLLGKTLKEIERVLKPDKYFTLMFNSLDDETWNNLLAIIHGLKFELHDIGTMGYSATSVVQDNRAKGLKTDFVFTFKKIKQKQFKKILSKTESDKGRISSLVDRYLAKNPKSQTYQILNYVIADTIKQGESFHLSDILDILDSKIKVIVKAN